MKTATNLHPELIESLQMEGYDNRQLIDREVNHFFNSHGVINEDKPLTTLNWTLFDMLAFLNY